ncbi:MAG: hypothetical protein UX04_C0006G0040 [Microgenomates group bacterium GW2011_GWF2_45_18]|nr:MAG: hypothetical protein UW18_C0006G0041 [Microgenomates group bacterium GW2011_GWF1_44_10]KKU01505.1 MAG: hypothetical protein UX04_C0006G0040 [Microgenomates group bacterium GW2011_GWF2_45_18]OGJ40564.1 MAG: hypothetical protein A2378_01750 [Candidatus Pacebacteria bacterium RIFOXYB1_FULL_44_10]HAU99413.1 hypothetical protein [Candidatus Paceibacterota bacterium]HAX01580.1 hypothetical protein [Candidatus Paceibacterota bacterium]
MKKIIVAITTSTLLLSLFTFLLIHKDIGTLSYSSLAVVSLLVGFVIYFKDEIGEIDLKKMKLVLRKTQKVGDNVNKTAKSLAEIIANLSTYSSGSWLNRKKLNDEVEKLLINIDVDPNERKEILDLPRIMEKGMKDMKSLTPEEKVKAEGVFKLQE